MPGIYVNFGDHDEWIARNQDLTEAIASFESIHGTMVEVFSFYPPSEEHFCCEGKQTFGVVGLDSCHVVLACGHKHQME